MNFLRKISFIVVAIGVAFNPGCKKNDPVTPSPPAITNVSVKGALINSVITINGNNFTPDIAKNVVSFNGIQATVVSATSTQVVFIVPQNATTSKIALISNGVKLTTPDVFTIYNLSDKGFQSNLYARHMTVGSGIYLSADVDIDSVGYQYLSISGAANQYVGLTGGQFLAVTPQTQLWGIVYAGGYQYAASINDRKIYKFAGTQSSATVFAGSGTQGLMDGQGISAQFTAPRGMVLDTLGNIYVNDVHRIRKITPAGLVSTFAGNGADGDADGQGIAATFGNLYDIAIDAAGNLYVTDSEFPVVRKITPAGMVTTVAGSNTAGFVDATGNAAKFYGPKGITVDPAGNILISDSNYTLASGSFIATIRMINQMGSVTTLLNNSKGDVVGNPGSICYVSGAFYIFGADISGLSQQAIMGNYLSN